MIKYIEGDATQPEAMDLRLIVHICNDLGVWGAGFTHALSTHWYEPENEYRLWFGDEEADRKPTLGEIQNVQVADDLWVVNMIAQSGVRRRDNPTPIHYEALETCLTKVAELWSANDGVSVHMPRIGTGLAGGDWGIIEPIIERTLCAAGMPVTVYTLPK